VKAEKFKALLIFAILFLIIVSAGRILDSSALSLIPWNFNAGMILLFAFFFKARDIWFIALLELGFSFISPESGNLALALSVSALNIAVFFLLSRYLMFQFGIINHEFRTVFILKLVFIFLSLSLIHGIGTEVIRLFFFGSLIQPINIFTSFLKDMSGALTIAAILIPFFYRLFPELLKKIDRIFSKQFKFSQINLNIIFFLSLALTILIILIGAEIAEPGVLLLFFPIFYVIFLISFPRLYFLALYAVQLLLLYLFAYSEQFNQLSPEFQLGLFSVIVLGFFITGNFAIDIHDLFGWSGLFSAALSMQQELLMIFNKDGKIYFANPIAKKMFGILKENQSTAKLLFHPNHRRISIFPDLYESIEDILNGLSSMVKEFTIDSVNRTTIINLRLNAISLGPFRFCMVQGLETTNERAIESALIEQTWLDSLTQIPSRQRGMQIANELIGKNIRFTCVCLDIDNFQIFNQRHGNELGDKLLIGVSNNVKKALLKGETLFRLQGDQFIILGPTKDDSATRRLAERIEISTTDPIQIKDRDFLLNQSFGYAVWPDHGQDAQEILENALYALGEAKKAGTGKRKEFNHEWYAIRSLQRWIDDNMERGITHEEFVPYYQPIINKRNNSLIGAEALLRWIHPERGMICPGDFIPIAERNGLIMPIGEFILRRATRDAEKFSRHMNKPFLISVNVSPSQFFNTDIISLIQSLVENSKGIVIQLEITEGMLIQDMSKVSNLLNQFRNIGVRSAVDDFGTGYSSLQYLSELPVDSVKVDRSFVKNLNSIKDDQRFLRSVVALLKELNFSITTEGIENTFQEQLLLSIGCEILQGFKYSKPVNFDAFLELIRDQSWINTN
jgi:diguanylate cyclase (GGDEF)-like protein